MRTSQVALRAGVNPQTLRYYERRGLLPEPARLESGYRSYDSRSVATIRFVKRAQALGFTLTEIEALLHLAAGGPESCEGAHAMASQKIGELDAKIASLQAMRLSLQRLAATCELPPAQRECPIIESLAEDEPR